MAQGSTLPDLEIETSIHDVHRGEVFGYATARLKADGMVVGHADYSVYDGEIEVKLVQVLEPWRRRGIATAIYEAILAEHPDATLSRSGTWDAGEQFRDAFDEAHRERITPREPARPDPFSNEDWERVSQMASQARVTYGRASAVVFAIDDLMNQMNDYDNEVHGLPLSIKGRTMPEKPTIPTLDEIARSLGPEDEFLRRSMR